MEASQEDTMAMATTTENDANQDVIHVDVTKHTCFSHIPRQYRSACDGGAGLFEIINAMWVTALIQPGSWDRDPT